MHRLSLPLLTLLSFFSLTFSAHAALIKETWEVEVTNVQGKYLKLSLGDSYEFSITYDNKGERAHLVSSGTLTTYCADTISDTSSCDQIYNSTTYPYFSDALFSIDALDLIDFAAISADSLRVWDRNSDIAFRFGLISSLEDTDISTFGTNDFYFRSDTDRGHATFSFTTSPISYTNQYSSSLWFTATSIEHTEIPTPPTLGIFLLGIFCMSAIRRMKTSSSTSASNCRLSSTRSLALRRGVKHRRGTS